METLLVLPEKIASKDSLGIRCRKNFRMRRGGVQRSMGDEAPSRMLICHPVSSRPLMFLQRKAVSYPENLLRLFFASEVIFNFSELIFRDPPRISFKTNIKIASRGYFYFLRFFFASRGYSRK